MSDYLTDAELADLENRAQTASVLYPFSCRFDVAQRLLAELRELRAEVRKSTKPDLEDRCVLCGWSYGSHSSRNDCPDEKNEHKMGSHGWHFKGRKP